MEEIRKQLAETVKRLFGVEIEPEVTPAPEDTGADYASNVAMKLAKEVRKNPRKWQGCWLRRCRKVCLGLKWRGRVS